MAFSIHQPAAGGVRGLSRQTVLKPSHSQKPAKVDQDHLLDYAIRRASENDLDDLFELAELSGAGFTSLPVNRALLAARLKEATKKNTEDHLLMLQHKSTGKVVGCAAIKARSGITQAHWNFRLSGADAASPEISADTVLIPTRTFAGASELGSLFLHPDHRLPGVGRFLSLSRLMLIGSFPDRFSSLLWSELRGVVSSDAYCPFYEAVMGPRLKIAFKEADHRFALSGDAGLRAYLPNSPVRVGDLPESVRGIIGQTHEAGRGARRLLEGAGFSFSGVVDLFDGGPIVAAMKEDLPLIAKAKPADGTDRTATTRRSLVADFDRDGRFSCQVAVPHKTIAPSGFSLSANRVIATF